MNTYYYKPQRYATIYTKFFKNSFFIYFISTKAADSPSEKPPLSGRIKSFAEFFAKAKNKIKIIFGRGVYVDKNTSQAASVEFVRHRRTNSARSRLQKLSESPKGDFRQAESGRFP